MIDITKPMRVKVSHEPAKVVFVDEASKRNTYLVVVQQKTTNLWLTWGEHLDYEDAGWVPDLEEFENVPEPETAPEPPQAPQPPQEEAPLPSIPTAAEMAQRAKEAQAACILATIQDTASRGAYMAEVRTELLDNGVEECLVSKGYRLAVQPTRSYITRVSWSH